MGLTRPSDEALRVIGTAHEQLILMFDQIAASQDVRGAPSAISLLESLDLDAPAMDAPSADTSGVEVSQAMVTLPEDDVDLDILAIFLEEAEELQLAIDTSIHGWSGEPGGTEHRDDLLRHLHTIKGSARLAGLNSLGEYTHNMETDISRQDAGLLDQPFFEGLNRQQDEISRRVGIYQKLSAGHATEEELASLRSVPTLVDDSAPSIADAKEATASATVDSAATVTMSLPEDDIDPDILPIFMEEAEELLESIDQAILDWSGAPEDSEHLDLLLRHLHTLKGSSRLAGMNSLGEYTHHFETRLIEVQQQPEPLNDAFFNDVNARQDEITRRFEIYQRYAAGEVGVDALAEMTVVTAAAPTTAVATPAAPVTDATSVSGEPPAEAETTPQVQSEVIRVSSDLLASLISMAGESSITRGRVEQQIRDFVDSLEEMEETISRIREHVRQLEIEAESRETVFRTRTPDEADEQSAFDDLEMDRYTMLQEVSRVLSEGASDMMDLKDTLVDKSRDAETMLHQQARINRELQEGLTRTRMEPFARLIPRLRRIVRQISTEVGKSVKFDAFNVEGELDRNVLDRIVAPLEHMLRNAVDHGIESPEDRHTAGKPEQGRISLRLDREGGYVVLTVSDDGGGINVDAVRSKAIERGLIDESGIHTDHDVMQFIMHAGFSTAQQVTQISGRGVGMDVVASEIKSLGGTITIDSTPGVGTEFTIRLPFTVSINRALMVVVAEETYAVPLNTIEGIVRVSPYELEAYYQPENAPMYEYAGQPYRLEYMGKMLGRSDDPNLDGQVAQLPVILARSGDDAVALQVDRVIGSREVVVKSLGPQFGEVGGVTGATVLGDGSVVVILDVMALVQSEERRHEAPEPVPEVQFENTVKTVMIVDDSVTVRKVTSRLMERNGFEVLTAKDGVDALNQLQDVYPSIVLLDIEMPRMDGFEVLRTVRRDDRLKDLPIIMITSRTGGKHQQQAEELGVNRYLGKPFQEAVLMETIDEVMAETQGGVSDV
ncbi:MAG: hybrid sensor histidine kinase/response regulator [Pseudomonadota bacterium]